MQPVPNVRTFLASVPFFAQFLPLYQTNAYFL